MKKNILFTLMFTWFAVISSAQIVSIPDTSFKAALLNHIPVIDTSGDGEIQVNEAAGFTDLLDVAGENIFSLLGIEAFTSIDSLDCSYNELASLDLSQNTALTYMTCASNEIISLNVSQNTGLIYLICRNNNLSSLNVTQNTALKHLDCSVNVMPSVNFTQNTALEYLSCRANNPMSSLDISQNTLLTTLVCSSIGQLTSLNLSTNTQLSRVELEYCSLTSLDLSTNTQLTILNVFANDLSILDLTQNTLLEALACGANNLSTLDLTQNVLLTNLSCRNNNLSTLDLSQNVFLTHLYCNNNQLSTMDLSQSVLLYWMDCSQNQLSTLDLSQNVELRGLTFSNNPLVTLDLSQSEFLLTLICTSGPQLSSIDLRTGHNLYMVNSNLKIQSTPNLFCVSVDDPIWSTQNWTNIDTQITFSSDCDSCRIILDNTMDVSCADSGQINTSFLGGSLPASYNWHPLANTTSVDHTTLNLGGSGVYYLSVTDSFNCQASVGTVINGPSSISSSDLTIQGNQAGVFRPGFLSNFNVLAYNSGCIPESGQVQVVYSGSLNFDSASNIPPDLVSGNVLTWDFTNWAYSTPQFLNNLIFQVDSNAILGDQVCFSVSIIPSAKTTSNNSKYYCYDIANSYDPNDKQVYPQGKCDPNYVLAEDKLTYTVRFQNTGNAEAIDIYILDSLDADLDLNSVRVVSQSHEPLITEVLDNNVLKFRFDNILLPDSFSNEPESHGFVIYEITPLTGLANGTEIENSAAIYFDLNAPIITNTVLNTIIDVIPVFESQVYDTILDTASYTLPDGNVVTSAGVYTSLLSSQDNCDSSVVVNLAVKSTSVGIRDRFNTPLDVNLYPNPASSSFTLKLEGSPKTALLEVQNILGQIVYTTDIENKETAISTSDWTDGIYHVLVKDNEGKLLASKKLVLLR